jgi:hypothetical protein
VRLSDLDERFVPAIAERLDRLVARLPSLPEPSAPAPLIVRLRRVDDRWTQRGALATLREIPQLGAVLIGLLILVGCVTAKSRIKPARPAVREPVATATTDVVPSSGHLGPQVGDNVTTYLNQARARLSLLTTGQPDATAVAVISFDRYLTPARVVSLVGTLQVRRVYLRASPLPLKRVEWHSVVVEDVVRDTTRELLRIAAIRTRMANENLSFARTITNDPAEKAGHERDAQLFLQEAAVLKGRCACVYAVVVRARARLLADLATRPGVRVVDPSPPAARLEDFTYTGLLPEEKKTVTGGNQG